VSITETDSAPDSEDGLMSLDFTAPGAIVKPTPTPVATAPPNKLEPASRLKDEGQFKAASALLEAALNAGEDFGKDAETAWKLLLECYQTLNQRAAFDACALEFARRFEKSPPPWVATTMASATAPEAKTIAASLAGMLNAHADLPLKQVLKVCVKNPVRIDLSRLTDADDEGCALLLAALGHCRKIQGRCRLAGAGRLAELLAGKTLQGVRADQNAWLLRLELYQRLGRQDLFEDAAVEYAVSFEVSPPSWDPAGVGDCEN